NRTNEPLARDEVVFAGQPVAIVVAESEAAAEDGAEAVVVDYSPLPAVLDLEEAMAPDSPLARRPTTADEGGDLESAHAGVSGGEEELPEEDLSGNVLRRAYYADGDLDAAFATMNPASAEIFEVRIGATAEGVLTALEARVIADRGENPDWGVEDISAILVAGPYRWQAYRIRGYGVQTNHVTFGAYRGPGAPPAAFALESLVDELAQALGLDPVELRLTNAVQEGDKGVTGQAFPVMGARECLERAREHPIWRDRGTLPEGEGVGLALGYWPGGNEPASSICRLDADGGLTVITGAVDMTGTETGFAAIAAAAFGLPMERVRVTAADTSAAPYSGASGGSKVTYTVGRAVQRAAEGARERLLQAASEELEIAPDDLEIVDGRVRARGA